MPLEGASAYRQMDSFALRDNLLLLRYACGRERVLGRPHQLG
jgi:hypothetical protein